MDFNLNRNDNLDVTIGDVESLDFSLGSDGYIDFGISTPSNIGTNPYEGDYEVTPKTYSQTLETKSKYMTDDVTILEIPYFETSNESDGLTVYIANTLA